MRMSHPAPTPVQYDDLLPHQSLGSGVPRVIHQVYATKDLPEIIRRNIDQLKALNPEWEHRLYDDADMADFISQHYGPTIRAYYERINPKYGASRADFFRYLLIYRFGGVYLDIKSSLGLPLDTTLHSDEAYILSVWRNGRGERFEGWGRHPQLKDIGGQEFQQWHIIAAPGHPFLRAVILGVLRNIDSYNPFRHDTGKTGVLTVTGPIAYTRAITPLLRSFPHRLLSNHEDLGLVYSIFGSTTGREHKSIFRFHYTELREPVVRMSGSLGFVWRLLGPLQIQFKRIREAALALEKRIPSRRVLRG